LAGTDEPALVELFLIVTGYLDGEPTLSTEIGPANGGTPIQWPGR
jgi:hypothetical protein